MIIYKCTNETTGTVNNINIRCLVKPYDPSDPFRKLSFWEVLKFKILNNRHVNFLL